MKSYSKDIKTKTIVTSYIKDYIRMIPILKLKVTGYFPDGTPIYEIPKGIRSEAIKE